MPEKMKKDELIKQNLPLVHSLARRFIGRGADYEELYSAGCVGLVKACEHFDESRGFSFSTYAVPVILGEIKRIFRDEGAVKVSRSIKELSIKAARVRAELSKNGCEPTVSQIAEALKVDAADVAQAVCASQRVMSLTDEEGSEIPVAKEGEENKLIDRIALAQVLDKLEKNDRALIILRYFRGLTQSRTAEALGMTQVQVSRRERKILEKMRELLT